MLLRYGVSNMIDSEEYEYLETELRGVIEEYPEGDSSHLEEISNFFNRMDIDGEVEDKLLTAMEIKGLIKDAHETRVEIEAQDLGGAFL